MSQVSSIHPWETLCMWCLGWGALTTRRYKHLHDMSLRIGDPASMEEQRTATDQQRKYVCAKCGGKGILLTPEGEGLLQFLLRHTNVETV